MEAFFRSSQIGSHLAARSTVRSAPTTVSCQVGPGPNHLIVSQGSPNGM